MSSGKQTQLQSQKLIQDVYYSTQIFFNMMSALESLVYCMKKIDPAIYYPNKEFSNYDRVDYSSKNAQDLMSQLQIQILLCKNSRIMIGLENPGYVLPMPQNFSTQLAVQYAQKYRKYLLDLQKDGD